ncbi:AraC family transcriptional regulator [Agromyces sp. LHK192]|uniref:helix-turn-helix domain-containing protein n=1 Tax=Agromyces sp. LHK192 TaxID=2498704 RepID=UPI000FD96019|nr:AraC family transcriptional regulator [Agromyces sp. LHK192]
MSPTGQNDERPDATDVPVPVVGVLTNAFAVREASEWGWHRHEVHELLWGTRGSLVVDAADSRYTVPWTRGLWIPAGTAHRVVAGSGTEFSCTFVATRFTAPRSDVGSVTVSGLARALLAELSEHDLDDETRALAERLAVRLLDGSELTRLDLPWPSDDRTQRVAEAVVVDPADARTLEDWGSLVGASERNLSRLFHRQTGLTFAEWRTKARMRSAIDLLADGMPVATVGRRVGYATASAFVQAFRREVGCTPGAFAAGESGQAVRQAASDGGHTTSG